MSSELILSVKDNDIDEMDHALSACRVTELVKLSPLKRTLTLAKGMQVLRRALNGPAMKDLLELANTKLGFKTDKAPGTTDKNGNAVKPYPEHVIRDCVIEAMIRGASPVGNEFNVISGQCYLTKEFYERAVGEFEGLTDLKLTEGVPQQTPTGALVPYWASWRLNGQADEIRCEKVGETDTRIPVKVNAGMGIDAILGKAKRKMLAKIYVRVTGSKLYEADAVQDVDEIVVEAEPVTAEPEFKLEVSNE